VASIIAPNFAGFYGGTTQGSCLVTATSPGNGIRGLFGFNDNTANNRIEYRTNNLSAQQFMNAAGVTGLETVDTGFNITANAGFSLATAYAANDHSLVLGGGAPVTDTACAVPNVDRLFLGTQQSAAPLNGTIGRFVFWSARLPDGTLQRLTAP
jgi:hypothetical protein